MIRAARLDSRRPFAGTTESKLAESGTISAAYSAHDFRHFYAITEFRKDRDVYRVSKLLGHTAGEVD